MTLPDWVPPAPAVMECGWCGEQVRITPNGFLARHPRGAEVPCRASGLHGADNRILLADPPPGRPGA